MAEQCLIVPDKKETWRPFIAYGCGALVVILVCLPEIMRGSRGALGGAMGLILTLVLAACLRKFLWMRLRASTSVWWDTAGLVCMKRGRVLHRYPWAGMRHLALIPGNRFPEWTRWASFSEIRISRLIDGEMVAETTPQFLLVTPGRIMQADQELKSVAGQFVARDVLDDSQSGV